MPTTPNLDNLSTPSMSTVSELAYPNEIIPERTIDTAANNRLSNSNISTRTNYDPTNENLPHIDSNFNGHRRNSDYALYQPRHFSDVNIEARKEQIIKNTKKAIIQNIINDNSDEKKSCFRSKSGKLIKKLGSKFVELDEKLEE